MRRQVGCWTILLAAVLIPVMAWAHGEVEGGGEVKAQRILQSASGKYRLEFTISPSLPVAGEDTNFELSIVRLLPKADPLLGSEAPVNTMPDASVLEEKSKDVMDRAISLHHEGEAGVFGANEYHFRKSGSLLLRFVVHTGQGEDLTADFPVSVKTNVAALFRIWVDLAITALIVGLTLLQVWKLHGKGAPATDLARPVTIGLASWMVVFFVINFFVLDKVLALRKPPAAAAAPSAVKANPDGSYTIPADIQKVLNIATVAAKEVPIEQTVSAYGTAEAEPERVADVIAPLWGRIEFAKGPLAVGDHVEKGQQLVQVILELSEVERQPMEAKQMDIRGGLQKAKDRRDAAQVEYQRAQKLAAADPAYEQDMKWAKQWLDQTTDSYEQVAKQDRDYVGTIKFRDPRHTPVTAPIGGTITFMGFVPGQLNLNGDYLKVFTITDTSEVRVRGDVYLPDVWKLKAGDRVLVHPAERANAVLKGTVHWIGDTVDPNTQTVPVLVDVPNSNQELAVGGFVHLEFPLARQKGIAVPEQSIVDDGRTKRIYLAVGTDQFQPVQVEVGGRKDGLWQVTSGLQPGDQVIANGAGLLGAMQPANPPEQNTGAPTPEPAQEEPRGGLKMPPSAAAVARVETGR